MVAQRRFLWRVAGSCLPCSIGLLGLLWLRDRAADGAGAAQSAKPRNRRRFLGLDRIDPTTVLINEHVFSKRQLRMVARSERLPLDGQALRV